ncbi:MAG: DUF3343 domain-containing protein [Clostridia bacterium]|nr:DUF3343 domain-containing protein [Clostridia bacterium]
MSTRCLGVRSVTYAQKARDVLTANGVACRILRQNRISGCGWCVALSAASIPKAEALLRENGVKTTGEYYDLS